MFPVSSELLQCLFFRSSTTCTPVLLCLGLLSTCLLAGLTLLPLALVSPHQGFLVVGLPPQTQVQGAVPLLSHSVILSLRLCLLTDLSSPWELVSPWMTLHQGWYVLCPGPVLPNLDFSYP